MSELRIGLVGTGGIGRTHIERINTKLQGAKVVACADPAAAFGLSVAEKFGIKGYEDPIAMINDPEIDAIINTTADAYHEQFVTAAIKAGKYVFCEKPLAPKADACKRIIAAEMEAGKPLVQVGFMRRYDAGYKQVKEILDSGAFGAPLILKCTHRNPEVGTNYDTPMAVHDTAIHEIDVLHWLIHDEYVSAQVMMPRTTKYSHPALKDPRL
ncbi:MAG: Gfo/Idh/MocA family oxidoreductase [Butyricicoccus sp.]|nr:Gfo/Idh/MocA family oxidoreductase [Butyricicoccus sp.]